MLTNCRQEPCQPRALVPIACQTPTYVICTSRFTDLASEDHFPRCTEGKLRPGRGAGAQGPVANKQWSRFKPVSLGSQSPLLFNPGGLLGPRARTLPRGVARTRRPPANSGVARLTRSSGSYVSSRGSSTWRFHLATGSQEPLAVAWGVAPGGVGRGCRRPRAPPVLHRQQGLTPG